MNLLNSAKVTFVKRSGDVGGPVDFMLVDIWDVARPALELVSSKLRTGAHRCLR